MSRSAKDTGTAIFGRLARYAGGSDFDVPAGARHIFLDETEYNILVSTRRVAHMTFGRHQAAALIDTVDGELLAFAGFEAEDLAPSTYVREIERSAGLSVAMLADLEVEPSTGPASVYNVVAAASGSDADYAGHDVDRVLELFPRLRLLEIDDEAGGVENFEANVLGACAKQSADGNGWIDQVLAGELELLAEQRIQGLPYEFLIRAVLDLNPTSLYLALYRCLEATYAYTKAIELAEALGIDTHWVEVAQALGDTLSWYPRHDQALASVLVMPTVDPNDLEALAASLGVLGNEEATSTRVSAAVRKLRNNLVHYGPTTQRVEIVNNDWNALCAPLARIVGSVFVHTYASPSEANPPPEE